MAQSLIAIQKTSFLGRARAEGLSLAAWEKAKSFYFFSCVCCSSQGYCLCDGPLFGLAERLLRGQSPFTLEPPQQPTYIQIQSWADPRFCRGGVQEQHWHCSVVPPLLPAFPPHWETKIWYFFKSLKQVSTSPPSTLSTPTSTPCSTTCPSPTHSHPPLPLLVFLLSSAALEAGGAPELLLPCSSQAVENQAQQGVAAVVGGFHSLSWLGRENPGGPEKEK